MAKKDVFKQNMLDFIERPLKEVIPRDIDLPQDVSKVISLIGPRRSGKTWLLFQLILRLRKKIPAERLIYVNFEDDRLFPLEVRDLDLMLRSYYELFPENKDKTVWFFLDEVQEVPGWEKFVRRLYDQENCRVYITGSSSSLLSKELASTLRGRTLPFEIYPLSFSEFLKFKNIKARPGTSKGQALMIHSLNAYFRQGGFPELVFMPENLHNRIINEYIDLMLYRDLLERFSLKNPHLLKYLLKYLLTNISTLLSTHKIFRDLKSQGYDVSKNTVYDYISFLEDAFAVFRVNLHTRSIRKQAVNPSKVYGIDPAFKYAMSMEDDKGRVMENLVFLELKRRGENPEYFQNGQEVDFIFSKKQLMNVCLDLDDHRTRSRETAGLISAMKELKTRESTLISWDIKEDIREDGRWIRIIPMWEWLLQNRGQ